MVFIMNTQLKFLDTTQNKTSQRGLCGCSHSTSWNLLHPLHLKSQVPWSMTTSPQEAPTTLTGEGWKPESRPGLNRNQYK